MKPLISVIVPIYNVETHLNKCVNSIINQTYKNLEILLIDDGSKDNSGKICDDYASADSRIKVFHKANGGVADARNFGIQKMNGEYFGFIDSDDIVHQDYIKRLYELISEYDADISMCAYVYKWSDGTTKKTRNTQFTDSHIFFDNGKDALKQMLYSKVYSPACWARLFNKKTIRFNFPHFAIGEDMLASVSYFSDANKVVMTNEPFYYYMQHDESVMHSINPEKVFDLVITGDEMMKLVSEKCPENKMAAAYYIIEKNIDAFMKISSVGGNKDKLNIIKNNIMKYRKVVISDSNAHKYLRKECKAAGFGMTSLIAYKKAKKLIEKAEKFFMEEMPKLLIKITNALPRHNIIIFESIPSFADNTYWFFKYLVENTNIAKKYKLVWRVRTVDDIRNELCGTKIKCFLKNPKTLKQKIELGYYQNFAKYIVDCNDFVYKKHPKQKRIFLGHGMPFKVATDYVLEKGEVDMNILTTYCFNEIYHKLGDTDELMRNFGYPRNDILAENAGIRKNKDKTYIIWMPTYRQHTRTGKMRIENSFPLGLPVVKSHEQMREINEHLKENNTVLYLRPHPSQDLSVMKLDEMSNIVIADSQYIDSQGIQLYEFLAKTDALISDYSSVYYDYLLLERPIALAMEDLEEYKAKWPIAFDDVKANYKCQYLDTVEDLKKFITDVATDNYKYEKEILEAKKRFNDFTDNKASERIYNFMVNEYGL